MGPEPPSPTHVPACPEPRPERWSRFSGARRLQHPRHRESTRGPIHRGKASRMQTRVRPQVSHVPMAKTPARNKDIPLVLKNKNRGHSVEKGLPCRALKRSRRKQRRNLARPTGVPGLSSPNGGEKGFFNQANIYHHHFPPYTLLLVIMLINSSVNSTLRPKSA